MNFHTVNENFTSKTCHDKLLSRHGDKVYNNDMVIQSASIRSKFMFPMEKMSETLKKYCTNEELFDYYRIVEPVTHQVYDMEGGRLIPYNELCHCFWSRKNECTNCSSIRAIQEQNTIVKLEYMESMIYLVFSVPVTINKETYVLECIKDVTLSLMVNSVHDKKGDNKNIASLIHRFNELLIHDDYTGLYNKSYVYQKLSEDILKAKRADTMLAAVVIDIDDFKEVNDTYGHVAGDRVIMKLASKLKECQDDENVWAARIGGDEFLLVFKNTSEEIIQQTCRKLQTGIAEIAFKGSKERFHAYISTGAAVWQKEETAKELIHKADLAMYDEKRAKHMK